MKEGDGEVSRRLFTIGYPDKTEIQSVLNTRHILGHRLVDLA